MGKHHILKCEHCGAAVADNVKRCPYCGERNTFEALGMTGGLSRGEDGELVVGEGAQLVVGLGEDGQRQATECPFCGAQVAAGGTACAHCGNRVIIEHLGLKKGLVIGRGGQMVIGPGGSVTIEGGLTIGDGGGEVLEAARHGDVDALRRCVNEGQDLNERGKKGRRPLHLAVKSRSLEAARFLVAMGAEPDGRDENGDTPLHLAVRKNLVDFVRLLVASGGGTDKKNRNGKTPLDVARDKGLDEVAAILKRAGGDGP